MILLDMGLGDRPELDMAKVEELSAIEEGDSQDLKLLSPADVADEMSLLPMARLEAIQTELVNTSAQASAVLAYLLQLRDAQSQDAST